MSAYNHINGIIHCHSELSEDITQAFSGVSRENEHWHRNSGENYLFSLDVKECRIDSVMEALSRMAHVETMDPVDGEWFFVDGIVTFQYESKDSISHVKFAAGKMHELVEIEKMAE